MNQRVAFEKKDVGLDLQMIQVCLKLKDIFENAKLRV